MIAPDRRALVPYEVLLLTSMTHRFIAFIYLTSVDWYYKHTFVSQKVNKYKDFIQDFTCDGQYQFEKNLFLAYLYEKNEIDGWLIFLRKLQIQSRLNYSHSYSHRYKYILAISKNIIIIIITIWPTNFHFHTS